MSDKTEQKEAQPGQAWDRERLEKRKAELEQGLTQIQEQYRAAIHQQRGAIALVEQMLAELDAPPPPEGGEKKDRAALRRSARAEKRAKAHANGTAELAAVEAGE